MKGVLVICFLSILISSSWVPVENRFPVPPHNLNTLFYIQRSNNANTVMYEINRGAPASIDDKDPVHVYWIRYAEKGQEERLNYLERTLAYGVHCYNDQGKITMQFVASKKRSAEISLDEKGQAKAFMQISKKKSQLDKIFVQVTETGWLPKVQYVEFFGTDVSSHEQTYEKMFF
jgi:hypothetical protein